MMLSLKLMLMLHPRCRSACTETQTLVSLKSACAVADAVPKLTLKELMLQVTRAEPRRCVNAEAGGYLAGASSLRR